jgi:DNA-binding transcriptional LysR family regulator
VTAPPCINLLDWEDIRTFATLARLRRPALAAQALKIRSAELRHRLARLEKALSASLFARSGDAWRLTAAGAAALAEAAQMEMAACSLFEQVARSHAGADARRHRSSSSPVVRRGRVA